MNLKTRAKFKSYSYRLCDERDCEKIAWKVLGERQFCEKHNREFVVEQEEKAKEQHGDTSEVNANRTS